VSSADYIPTSVFTSQNHSIDCTDVKLINSSLFPTEGSFPSFWEATADHPFNLRDESKMGMRKGREDPERHF
jgi:hypothetical protein